LDCINIPDNVGTLDDLDAINHRDKDEDDWLVLHAQYVNLWHVRRDCIFTYMYSPIELDFYMF
jgi:hypothetical protein